MTIYAEMVAMKENSVKNAEQGKQQFRWNAASPDLRVGVLDELNSRASLLSNAVQWRRS